MLKTRLIVGMAALSVAAGMVVWRIGPADAAVVCNGVFQNQTINGNVTVPSGANCSLRNVNVTGSFSADSPNQILVVDSTVGGRFIVSGFQKNGTVSTVCGTRISGNTRFENIPAGATVDDDADSEFDVGGDDSYTGTPVGDFNCSGNSVGGTLEFSSVALPIEVKSNTIGGNFNLFNNVAVELDANQVSGSTHCTGVCS